MKSCVASVATQQSGVLLPICAVVSLAMIVVSNGRDAYRGTTGERARSDVSE